MSQRAAYLLTLFLVAEAILVSGRAPRLLTPQGREVLELARDARLRATSVA